MIANLLTPMQVMMLREACLTPRGAEPGIDKRIERINEVTDMIKRQSPALFFHSIESKPDPALKNRTFYDEPFSLMPDQYAGYKVQYRNRYIG